MRRIKSIKTSTTIIGLECFLVISDIMAGRRNRYTVYQIDLGGMKRAKIIGRELTVGHCRRLIVSKARGLKS